MIGTDFERFMAPYSPCFLLGAGGGDLKFLIGF